MLDFEQEDVVDDLGSLKVVDPQPTLEELAKRFRELQEAETKARTAAKEQRRLDHAAQASAIPGIAVIPQVPGVAQSVVLSAHFSVMEDDFSLDNPESGDDVEPADVMYMLTMYTQQPVNSATRLRQLSNAADNPPSAHKKIKATA